MRYIRRTCLNPIIGWGGAHLAVCIDCQEIDRPMKIREIFGLQLGEARSSGIFQRLWINHAPNRGAKKDFQREIITPMGCSQIVRIAESAWESKFVGDLHCYFPCSVQLLMIAMPNLCVDHKHLFNQIISGYSCNRLMHRVDFRSHYNIHEMYPP